jgi:hypothetical protein
MTDDERRRREAFQRVKQYYLDNAADFPTGSVQRININKIIAELDNLEDYAADQAGASGAASSAFEMKDTLRETMIDYMERIAATARTMEPQFDGISNQYKMPKNKSDQSMLDTAYAWVESLPAHETDFKNYGMPDDFITVLNDAADGFKFSMNAPTTAVDQRVAATALIAESIRRGMAALKACDGVMQNLYDGNPGKLAAWDSASRIEKAPKKKVPTPPTP